jgi:hypothetical protein
LLHGNGANNSTTFTDSSSNAVSIIRQGDAKISTAQSKFGGSSIAFDGAGDALTSAVTAAMNPFNSGDFTIELWAYITSLSNNPYLFSTTTSGGGANRMALVATAVGQFEFYTENASAGESLTTSPGLISTNSWLHLAATRSGSTTKLFVNGSESTSSSTYGKFTTANQRLEIGAAFAFNSNYLNGFIDELRITKGVARYTSTFTPPTAPFPDA